MARSENVGNTVRDHTRLPATRTRQNEERPLGMAYGFPLLRIQAFEEIHEGKPFKCNMLARRTRGIHGNRRATGPEAL